MKTNNSLLVYLVGQIRLKAKSIDGRSQNQNIMKSKSNEK